MGSNPVGTAIIIKLLKMNAEAVKKYISQNLQGKLINLKYGISNFQVKYYGFGKYYGFEIDDDHLYLDADSTVHHNSGKTVLFSYISQQAKLKGSNIIILPYRDWETIGRAHV